MASLGLGLLQYVLIQGWSSSRLTRGHANALRHYNELSMELSKDHSQRTTVDEELGDEEPDEDA